MRGVWLKNKAKYATGECYWIGRIKVGDVFMPSRSRDADPFYRASISLPSIKMNDGTTDFTTIEQAKARVETAVANWFKWLEQETAS